MEEQYPGSRRHYERVAVYAVATAERLGFGPDGLTHLRIASELRKLDPGLIESLGFEELDLRLEAVLELCDQFESRRTPDCQGDDERLRWLRSEARASFDPAHVDALESVQSLIQPTGT